MLVGFVEIEQQEDEDMNRVCLLALSKWNSKRTRISDNANTM